LMFIRPLKSTLLSGLVDLKIARFSLKVMVWVG